MYRPNRVSIRSFQRAEVDKSKDPDFWRAWDGKIDALAAKREAEKPENWPQSRMLAILMIHRSSIALDCMAHLSGSGVRARQHDFAYLRNHGYAVKDTLGQYHKLMPVGRRAAKTCADVLGKALGLHHVTFHFDSWSEHRARCCCGWSASVNRRANANAAQRLQAEFDDHMKNPDAWKTAGEASRAVINDLFPTVRGSRP